MYSAQKVTAIAGAALSALVLVGLLLTPSGAVRAGPPEPKELPGLREAPNIPVGSIILRRAFPDHPLPAPLEQEFPGPGVPGREGLPAPGGGGCDKDIDLTGEIDGVVAVAAQDNLICTSADIDTYVVSSGATYVVQGGGEKAAWTHTDVSDPSNPDMVGQWVWSGRAGRNTYTPDIKTFNQGNQDYIVMGLERLKLMAYCGVIIVNVTDPVNPVIESQFIGADWCDTHNVFVEDDPDSGDGKYIYATADGPNDMRVLDISGAEGSSVTNPIEIGRYTVPGANNNNYVHDVTVIDHGGSVGRRVYLAYWDSGLVVLNAADVTPGTNPTPIIGPNVIDPSGFLNHHSFPSEDGSLVFIQDEFLNSSGDEPVQMWDISNPASPSHVDGLVLGTDVPVNPAHNLEIIYDLDFDGDGTIDPNRLFVGWYKMGLQAWDFTSTGFVRNFDQPSTAVLYHQAQTEAGDDEYSGAWGVRLELIAVGLTNFLYIFQSDRNFGLIVDCMDCPAPDTGTVTGTVTDSSTSPIEGASVSADTGQSAITGADGAYTLSNVPTGTRTVTASATGYVTQDDTANVTDDGTSVVNFALAESTGGGDMHVGDLDDGGSVISGRGNKWTAMVTITVHDAGDTLVVAGATVSGVWSEGARGGGSCTTDAGGQCTVSKGNLKLDAQSATFTVTDVTLDTWTYVSGANHDPDGDSDGTAITVDQPL